MATAMHAALHAQQIAEQVKAFRRGLPVDSTVDPVCLNCQRQQEPGKKLLRCSECKVARYCDQKCATADWNVGHREMCKDMREAILKLGAMQAIAEQFPWAKQEHDGTFDFSILLASKSLLGSGREFGWWTRTPCCADRSRYVWGFQLLEEDHLTDDMGWRLRREHLPWLDFAAGQATPPRVPPPLDHSWSKYYEWRGLPLDSPAALLLHWPLTVYRLLHLLGLASAYPQGRRHLTVHLLGVEREIDFVPVFGELALLFPNTDLDLVFFGPGVAKLLEKAHSNHSCLASRPFVYMYKAPKVSGSGTIRIELSRSGAFYDGANMSSLRKQRPDAIIALDAGLCAYPEWRSVIFASRALAIPFAVTDYNEVSLRGDVKLLFRKLPLMPTVYWPTVELTGPERERIIDMCGAEYPIELNPFMHPGPRPQIVHGGPNSFNAYTLVVTPGAGA
ncbi:putative MYND finger [Lyophyllum shimeji]|uniref:MYND finger n=1 Tax=Lyophyllum shimeji TaxID=47721 RepID=A0A9P3UR54_LYOSH|nr:putative MYND finger [Lyophyllum shimeji]